jgi:hypothetical protein
MAKACKQFSAQMFPKPSSNPAESCLCLQDAVDLAMRLNPRVKAEVSAVLNPDGLQLLSESRKKTGKEEKLWGARLGGLGTLFGQRRRAPTETAKFLKRVAGFPAQCCRPFQRKRFLRTYQ